MTIKIYSITLKVFLIIVFGLSPVWVIIPVTLGVQIDNKYAAYILSAFLLVCCVILAHILARQKTDLTITESEVRYRKTSIKIKSVQNIKINKTGIGMSAIEFYMKTGKKHSLNMPNYKGNADRAIEFVTTNITTIDISERGYY